VHVGRDRAATRRYAVCSRFSRRHAFTSSASVAALPCSSQHRCAAAGR
jgi:hypothetical protein